MAPNTAPTRGAMVAARIPKELRRQLEELAAQQDRTMSWLIERAIRKMVAAQEASGNASDDNQCGV